MLDYLPGDLEGDGYYKITYGRVATPQGPYASVAEMATALNMSAYPSDGYVVQLSGDWAYVESSLNPDDLAPGPVSICILRGTHLTDCDDDGYCNYCGHQESADA